MPAQRPPVNVYRTPDIVTVAAPMPGLEADNISVDVTNDNMTAELVSEAPSGRSIGAGVS